MNCNESIQPVKCGFEQVGSGGRAAAMTTRSRRGMQWRGSGAIEALDSMARTDYLASIGVDWPWQGDSATLWPLLHLMLDNYGVYA